MGARSGPMSQRRACDEDDKAQAEDDDNKRRLSPSRNIDEKAMIITEVVCSEGGSYASNLVETVLSVGMFQVDIYVVEGIPIRDAQVTRGMYVDALFARTPKS